MEKLGRTKYVQFVTKNSNELSMTGTEIKNALKSLSQNSRKVYMHLILMNRMMNEKAERRQNLFCDLVNSVSVVRVLVLYRSTFR